MKKPIIHIAETKDFSKEVISRLNGFAQVKTDVVTPLCIREAMDECDVFWFRLGFRITKELLDYGVRCRYILCPVTGLDHIDVEACIAKGIKVVSLRGETEFLKSIRATAEHSLGLALALLRNTCGAIHHVRLGGWNRDLFKGREIFGKTVGIVGVGRLGSIVAGYYKALGADVCGFDNLPFGEDTCTPVSSIEELFLKCDIITLHLSYNSASHHLVDRRLLSLMKPNATLINTSRGGVVNSEDLLWALRHQVISGAALDVLEDEFESKDNILVEYAKTNDNLIITPHIGGNTFESFARTEMFLCEKLEDILNNEWDG